MEAKKVALGVLGLIAAAKVLSWTFCFLRGELMVFQAKRRCRKIRSKKPELPAVSEDVKARILGCTASQLVAMMKEGKIRCVDVMATYVERAASIGRELNLTAGEVFEEAMKAAQAADRQREEEPESLGVLFGLPISIKDHIHQAGCCSSGGVIANSFKVQQSDSDLVSLIRKEGGIPFVRSNLTQVMMWFETESHLYGRAENPWDRARTTGGSSGGEGGLVASRCSPLGIGSDIGGSIRIPASFCGIYGFKPTPQRVRFDGVVNSHDKGYDSTSHLIPVSVGPLSKSVDDLAMLLRVWWQPEAFNRDPLLVPLSFDAEMYQTHSGGKPLRFGFFSFDGVFECHPAQIRLLNQAKTSLQALGHQVIDFEPPAIPSIMRKYVEAALAVGPDETRECLQGEPPCWFYNVQLALGSSNILKGMAMAALRLIGFGRVVDVVNGKIGGNSREFFEMHQFFSDYQLTFTKMWTDLQLDVMVCPATSLPAAQHGMTDLMILQLASIWLFNILRFPSGVLPAGQVYLSEERYESKSDDAVTKRAKKVMENASGLPVGIQVAALPYEDEKALGAMKILEGVFNFHKHPL